ncbi:hypothetical protein Belba_3710 [Belliella baltica DSM 15883]|uniref:N-acetyltransferase domain-containing protein n=1 Tax=Belliella baltica (strain DSM 15883 / CIP 108006 / LMG 21964 / BA134) TaxID=866536 RepID=I3ZAD0_BELBD|nr:hypothetical protein [Belliella baltica]AFL86198.1 hypothetical protein Belba_3710 [Belliella baltica DSM 15883]
MKVKIKVVKATDSPEETEKYIRGHLKVLESYGVTKVTSADRSWVNNPHVYLVLVESEDGENVLGGGRVQLRSKNFPLPLEGAIFEKDERIVDYMTRYRELKVAEFCGLWNSKEVSGYGIGSIYLIRIGVAITALLGLECIMAFCSPYTVANSQAVGLRIIEEIGENGTFLYPKEGLVATIMELEDVYEMKRAKPEEREFVFSLIKNPDQTVHVPSKMGDLEIEFNLSSYNLCL